MANRRAPVLVGLLCLVLAAGAALGARPLSPAEYRTRAGTVCARAEAGTLAIPVPRSARGVRAYLGRLLPVLARAVRDLDALEPPRRLAVLHEEYLAVGRRSIGVFASMRARVARGEDGAAVVRSENRRLTALDARGTAAATALGLPACAQEVGADAPGRV